MVGVLGHKERVTLEEILKAWGGGVLITHLCRVLGKLTGLRKFTLCCVDIN